MGLSRSIERWTVHPEERLDLDFEPATATFIPSGRRLPRTKILRGSKTPTNRRSPCATRLCPRPRRRARRGGPSHARTDCIHNGRPRPDARAPMALIRFSAGPWKRRS